MKFLFLLITLSVFFLNEATSNRIESILKPATTHTSAPDSSNNEEIAENVSFTSENHIPFVISDSIAAIKSLNTVEFQESEKKRTEIPPTGKIIERHSFGRQAWWFVLFLAQLSALIYLKAVYFRNMQERWKAYFNLNLAAQLFRDQENTLAVPVLVLMINALLSLSLLIYLLLGNFIPGIRESVVLLAQIFLFVSILYGLKYLAYLWLSWVFPFSEEISLFRFNYFLNQKIIGIILVPFTYVAAYLPADVSEYFLFIAVGIFLLSIIIRSLKGLAIGFSYLRRYTFHFLLYICAFEIAPVMIILKWLHGFGNGL